MTKKKLWIISVVVLALIGVLIIGLAVGRNPMSDEASVSWQEQYDLGVRYLSEGNYEEAIIAFTAAIEIDPKRIEAYQGLSDTYLAQGDSEKALEVWNLVPLDTLDEADRVPFSQQTTRYEDLVAFLESGDLGVKFTRVSFGMNSFLAGEETEFTVSVLYRCAESGDAMVDFHVPKSDELNRVQSVSGYKVQGSGILTFQFTATPNCTEGNYFEIGTDLFQFNHDYSDEVWIGSDNIYITPQGEVTSHSAPVNKYGATEFIYRDNFRDYELMSQTEQQVIDLVGNAVISNNMDSLYDLLDDYSWDMFSFANTGRFTMWNGYKMNIQFRPHKDNEEGDRTASVDIELRAEDGTGYVGRVYYLYSVITEGRDTWWDYYYKTTWGTCPCVDWQWNGEVHIREEYESLWRSADGTSVKHYYEDMETGTMKDNLRDGSFSRTRHIVETWLSHLGPEYNDYTDEIVESVDVYGNGVLLEKDGVKQDGDFGGADILGIGWGGDDDQSYLDLRFW